VFEQVAQKHRSGLPVRLQSRFSNAILRDVGKALQHMGVAVVFDEEDLASEKGAGRERSEIPQAYIWWRLKLAPYRGKWNDMHRLASAWHMSPAASVKSFRTVERRAPAFPGRYRVHLACGDPFWVGSDKPAGSGFRDSRPNHLDQAAFRFEPGRVPLGPRTRVLLRAQGRSLAMARGSDSVHGVTGRDTESKSPSS
jgi:hypothetical protein